MTKLYFENVKTKKRFQVIKMDKVKGTVTLKGDWDPFVEEYSKERFAKLGYQLVTDQAA